MGPRILVAGATGVGKSTLCRIIEARTGVPHTELDSLYHGAGWVPRASFVDDVTRLASSDTWVTEWGYHQARPILAAHADTLVWLDLPPRVSFGRLLRRTVQRSVTRAALWNGNVEPPLWTILTDPDHIIRWWMRTHRKYPGLVADSQRKHPHLRVIRLTSTRAVSEWIAAL